MYSQIIAADGWFFVHPNVNQKAAPTVWHLAAWGLTPEGEVVGLIAAFGADQGNKGVAPKLVTVPPVAGVYLHRDQLSDVEKAQLNKR